MSFKSEICHLKSEMERSSLGLLFFHLPSPEGTIFPLVMSFKSEICHLKSEMERSSLLSYIVPEYDPSPNTTRKARKDIMDRAWNGPMNLLLSKLKNVI
jgi:hypothetical protein